MMKKFEKVEQKDLDKVVGGLSQVASAQTAGTMAAKTRAADAQTIKTQSAETSVLNKRASARAVKGQKVGVIAYALFYRVADFFSFKAK